MYYVHLLFYTIFLAFLTTHILTSPSPVQNPALVNCSEFFNETVYTSIGDNKNGLLNDVSRWAVLIMFSGVLMNWILWISLFCLEKKGGAWDIVATVKKWVNDPESILVGFNIVTYILSFFSLNGSATAISVRSCSQWQVSALTMTLAWMNLLFHMRLLRSFGKYVLLFKYIFAAFVPFFLVIFILLVGFALSFHMLLSHRDNFENFGHALLKTMMMMSGEIEFGDIFYKDYPPKGWDQEWDQSYQPIPFPAMTYAIFLTFFVIVCLISLNVFVGLAVGETRKLIERAQIQRVELKLKYVLYLEHNIVVSKALEILDLGFLLARMKLDAPVQRGSKFDKKLTDDLPLNYRKNRIFDRIDQRKNESKQRLMENEREHERMKHLSHNVSKRSKTFDLKEIFSRMDSTTTKKTDGSFNITNKA